MTEQDNSNPVKARHSDGTMPVVRGHQGRVNFTLAALAERIERQLRAELVGRDDILAELGDPHARRILIADAGDYILAVESVALSPRERHAIFDLVERNVFGLGPLEDLLNDKTVTGVSIEGPQNVFVHYGVGRTERGPEQFDDEAHLREIVERLLAVAGAALREAGPFTEVGFAYQGRRGRLTIAMPPFSPSVHVDLRLHPDEAVTLEQLAQRGYIKPKEAVVLTALVASPYGVLVAGEPESGKTILLEALLHAVGETAQGVLVQRAAEIRPPESVQSMMPLPSEPDIGSFAGQLAEAAEQDADLLAVDELRGDDSGAIWASLQRVDAPRLLLTLRSSPDPVRLHQAISMIVLKMHASLTQSEIDEQLVRRLPFVLIMSKTAQGPRLQRICEWQPEGDGVSLSPLLECGTATGLLPQHPLSIPENFWQPDSV